MTESTEDEMTAALLWAMGHLDRVPEPPAQAIKAQHGRDALRTKLAAAGHRGPTRDEKRLKRRYSAALDAYDAEVLSAYRDR
jgi:hypothetical protein